MRISVLIVFCFWQVFTLCAAELKLADPFGDQMVLQRGVNVPVWGTADSGSDVTVEFDGQVVKGKADSQGDWRVALKPMLASAQNRAMVIISGTNRLELKDVLVGEVWIGSGQSNMEWGIGACDNGPAEIAAADYPLMRLRYVEKRNSPYPLKNIKASGWMVCSPANINKGTHRGFSGALYYFGRELHLQLNVPVGLIQSAWGGTIIEPWTPPEGFGMVPELSAQKEWLDNAKKLRLPGLEKYLDEVNAWVKSARAALATGGAVPEMPEKSPAIAGNNEEPSAIYNAMIAPFVTFAVKGAVWYQGESNNIRKDGAVYFHKMKGLIYGWRKIWGQGDFPFYFVQIAPFGYGMSTDDELPKLWAAQQEAAIKIPNTGMAHSQDIGNTKDIHPRNKQDVGRRLARLALSRDYGVKFIDDCGPRFREMKVEGQVVRIMFDHVNSGLASRDGKPLDCFEIAGADGKFLPAEAEISGKDVLVKHPQTAEPVSVRFAWKDVAVPNLMNGEKLPAAAFTASRGE